MNYRKRITTILVTYGVDVARPNFNFRKINEFRFLFVFDDGNPHTVMWNGRAVSMLQ